MNYFAHGFRFLDDPYFLAGTAVPDWLSVVDRQVRVRSRAAQPLADSGDPADLQQAAVARGILQHLTDDGWFHATRAFAELNLELSRRVREALPHDDGLRPSFLGHILVEILLDACLVQAEPERLEAYYLALGQVDGRVVQSAINRLAAKSTDRIAPFVALFVQERFLFDYADDARLAYRLNQVMRRVGLPLLPPDFRHVLTVARPLVAERWLELLTPEQAADGN